MQGSHTFQPELFVQIDYEKVIPQTHLLRRIAKVLDLGFIRKSTEKFYSNSQGRPSIDPEVFFRICILGHIYGIKSDRQLCEELEMNIAYRWFVGLSFTDAVPDHSSLSRVRDRLGVACFQEVFENIVEQCRGAGLVPGKRIITDASLVVANASARKLHRREASTDRVEAKPGRQPDKAGASQTPTMKREKVSNRTHVSKVDGDASLVNRKSYPRKLYHKVHYCADAASRVITDCHVTTGACHENTVITQRIEYQQKRFGLPIKEVIADVGYGSGKNYKFFEEHKMLSYIPVAKRRRDGKQRAYEDSFKYDKKQDIYKCQAGHALYPRHAVGATKYYHIKKVHCKSCQWRADCYLGNRYTGIYRNEHKESIERVIQRQTSQLFKQRMRERSWKIEGLFGEAKERHGLRRAKYRGSEKMQIQAYLTGITQNLKRLAASLDFYFHWIRFWFTQRFLLLRHSFGG